ncbi:hypothetical protein K458DRAFT_311869 [Lentithecium fluviatile CBS 122367]|uniref:Fe2OG dioxygenase domain-containing protein n=1 Tax=Lentithecium fluviatile CBS 122367 TaxID=1168545 RepID=A0A6G1IR01_9PLEO|nr:hypothetical protein K458DRAFT_311869 [Lentithecium fluviatile CBS 122367]
MAESDLPNGRDALQFFRIASLPPDFYYIPNFITMEEEASILGKIPAQRWVTLSHRRLQAHPSTLLKGHTLLASPLPDWLNKPVVERFKLLGIFEDTPHEGPNHVLINEYRRGEGIMPHEDGPAYAPVVATVSLGAPICLEITRKSAAADEEMQVHSDEAVSTNTRSQYIAPTRILQEPLSLLITTGPAYKDLLHGISPVEIDDNLNAETVANWNLLADSSLFEEAGGRSERATRISLTYRDVLKVSSAASRVFGGLGRR